MTRTSVLSVAEPPTRWNSPSWMDAEELGLDRQGELADLVEEEGAAVGELEAAAPLLLGPGEGSALVAEELALDDGLGQRGAVDRDEGALGAARALVEGAGDELLARSALAGDEHGRLGARDSVYQGEELAHRGRAADDGGGGPALVDAKRLGASGARRGRPTPAPRPRAAARARRRLRPRASATRAATEEARDSARSRATEVAREGEGPDGGARRG